ncbi:hypothetical protein niasHT_038858 [Heterodera trifolii]|uniref:Uncharacterized protein n=1 Tax=Heterodera trifolii TaxID=157864 RepID=A0ABD2IMB6_9BILA
MALLCAAEQDCMVPIGQTQACISTPITPNLTCHRQDQSLFGVLLYNMEYRQQIEGVAIRDGPPKSVAFSVYVVAKHLLELQQNGLNLSNVAEQMDAQPFTPK